MRKLIFIFCSIFFAYQSAFTQEKTISGRVVVYDSFAIADAVIQIKSSKQVILSDHLGRFEAVIQPNDKLKVSAKGFYSQTLKIEEDKNVIRVNLILKKGDRNMALALQNGHVTDSKKFKSARQLNADEDFDFSQYTTFLNLIEGRFPSVEIHPGGILIRGVKSLTSSSYALIVLNGAISDFSVLSSLAPANIKSVKIVTGSSAMRYGPGAGNGVMVIETKGFDN